MDRSDGLLMEDVVLKLGASSVVVTVLPWALGCVVKAAIAAAVSIRYCRFCPQHTPRRTWWVEWKS